MTKTVTTTRKYDDEGRLVEETVCEITTPDPIVLPALNPAPCMCGTSGRCYMHMPVQQWEIQPYHPTWTCATTTTNVVPIKVVPINAASAS